ncbi:MAG: hypothetical protein AVDCRST_MAG89-1590 [uncultured Gemmatimonadetes bacterium]|uniref:Uncharacterized protein n=1 Tax=uncultured Gemmatimonadota bacterium TaxID=203437 RepID=A0A6J4L0S3_9BACT|nr:MAG: hypothetical protein AVDCRST_MAG89-1590 [uncultured Gemmatimonadota bacterium]
MLSAPGDPRPPTIGGADVAAQFGKRWAEVAAAQRIARIFKAVRGIGRRLGAPGRVRTCPPRRTDARKRGGHGA